MKCWLEGTRGHLSTTQVGKCPTWASTIGGLIWCNHKILFQGIKSPRQDIYQSIAWWRPSQPSAGSIADCRGSSLWTGSGGLQSSPRGWISWFHDHDHLEWYVNGRWTWTNSKEIWNILCVCRINRRCVKHIKQSNDQLKSPSETRLLCVGMKLAPALLLVFSAQETLSLSFSESQTTLQVTPTGQSSSTCPQQRQVTFLLQFTT